MSRQRPWASSQGPITRAGSTTPIRPLDNIASPQKAQPASSQRRRGGPQATACARHSTAALMVPATSMSWLAYWPPMKKNGLVASSASAVPAVRASKRWRSDSQSAAPINQAPSAGASRTENGVTPNTDSPAMLTQ